MSGKRHALSHPNHRFDSFRFLHLNRRLERVSSRTVCYLSLHFLLAFQQTRHRIPTLMHLIVGRQATDRQRIQNIGILGYIAFTDGYTQFIERCHLILMRVAQTKSCQGEVTRQQDIGYHIQTAVHMYRAVHLSAQTRNI